MGTNFTSFLKSLSDHELAVYVGYQYESFLPYAREIARNEIELRQLSERQLNSYFKERLAHSINIVHCQRCGSNRFIQDKDIEHSGGQYSSSEIEVTTNRCRLCNYNPSKVREKNIFKRIKRFFFDPNKTSKTVRTYYWLDDKPHYPK